MGMKNNVISIGLGTIIGLVIGIGLTWYTINDSITQATIDAELRFNQLLEEEKIKYQGELGEITKIQENLEYNLTFAEMAIDSLNTTINARSKQLNQIKRKYAKKLSDIDSMSHNELTDFFTKRYSYDFCQQEKNSLKAEISDLYNIIEQDSILLSVYKISTDSLILLNKKCYNQNITLNLDLDNKNDKIKSLKNTRNLTILTTLIGTLTPILLRKS
jgi:uncharacterized coiled-coil protein SlyX